MKPETPRRPARSSSLRWLTLIALLLALAVGRWCLFAPRTSKTVLPSEAATSELVKGSEFQHRFGVRAWPAIPTMPLDPGYETGEIAPHGPEAVAEGEHDAGAPVGPDASRSFIASVIADDLNLSDSDRAKLVALAQEVNSGTATLLADAGAGGLRPEEVGTLVMAHRDLMHQKLLAIIGADRMQGFIEAEARVGTFSREIPPGINFGEVRR